MIVVLYRVLGAVLLAIVVLVVDYNTGQVLCNLLVWVLKAEWSPLNL